MMAVIPEHLHQPSDGDAKEEACNQSLHKITFETYQLKIKFKKCPFWREKTSIHKKPNKVTKWFNKDHKQITIKPYIVTNKLEYEEDIRDDLI